ncbi:hypothetical protein [Romboutsia sp. MSSM.1001216sp_RTP31141st1_G3_RTP31141_220114]|uniref:hypothetical protein n=1 Tax=unclassified Romboutsia TaxID=2626894 RepID=UPI0031B5C725
MTRLKFRRKEKKYTEVYNTIIFKNKNVELTGLYTIIQACIDLEINTQGTDDEFIITKQGIRSFTGYSEKKFDRIWLELKEAGYLKQYKFRNLDVNGKWLYEYELLDEPDLTTYHSLLIKDDGSIVPNIPKNKLEKMKKDQEEITSEKVAPQNRGVESSPLFLRGWEKEGFNNNYLNKVCMYVCRATKNFDLSNKNKEFIKSIKDKIDFDLFEQILVNASNKNKTFSYVEGSINNLIKCGILTYDDYIKQKELYKKNFNESKKLKDSNSSKKIKKASENRFKNFTETFTDYSIGEFNEIIDKSQKKKFEDIKVSVDMEGSNNNNDFSRMMYERCVKSNWNCVETTKKYGVDYAKANGLDYPKDI